MGWLAIVGSLDKMTMYRVYPADTRRFDVILVLSLIIMCLPGENDIALYLLA